MTETDTPELLCVAYMYILCSQFEFYRIYILVCNYL